MSLQRLLSAHALFSLALADKGRFEIVASSLGHFTVIFCFQKLALYVILNLTLPMLISIFRLWVDRQTDRLVVCLAKRSISTV